MRSGPREAWKARREAAAPQSRYDVRSGFQRGGRARGVSSTLGLVDSYFAEALGDVLQEGDKVVPRARDANELGARGFGAGGQ
jgi:hypothetical protein